MTISERGIAFIRQYEGLQLKAYPDPATGAEPITIGFGSTRYEDGAKIKLGDIITRERAEKMLRIDVIRYSEQVSALLKKTVTQNQIDSLVSIAYNIGIGNFKSSTLLKKVNADPNDITISYEFLKWNRGGNKVMNGLTKRRTEEALFYYK